MNSSLITSSDRTLLPAVQEVIGGSEQAILAVAFVSEAGVHLLDPQLRRLGGNCRLMATTAFGATSTSALAMSQRLGNQLRVLNPSGAHTYYPKVYIGRSGDEINAVIGSSNLTGGLITNIEVAVWLRGKEGDELLRETWEWAESLWRRPDAVAWRAEESVLVPTGFQPELLALIEAAVAENPLFETLGRSPQPNGVKVVTPAGLWVETERSRSRHGGAEEIPAWMFELAWDTLQARKELSNTELLNELRVHRSSAVCAILARLPGVRVASRNPIRLAVASGASS